MRFPKGAIAKRLLYGAVALGLPVYKPHGSVVSSLRKRYIYIRALVAAIPLSFCFGAVVTWRICGILAGSWRQS